MRKPLFTLSVVLLSLFSASCADENNEVLQPPTSEPKNFSYTGALQVGDYSMEEAAVVVDIYKEREGYMSIAMKGVRFSDKMPVSIDLVLNDIPCVEADGVLMFSAEALVPLVGGKAAEAYRFKFISGRINADASRITFVAQMADDLAANVAGMVFVYDAADGESDDDAGGVVVPPATESFNYGFSGTLQVGDFEQPQAVVSVAVNREAGTVDVKLTGVRFSDKMPVTLDITLCGLACENTGGVMCFSGENIVPFIGTEPSASYTFASVTGAFDMKTSTLTLAARLADNLASHVAGKEFLYNGYLKTK